ncbi:MAG: hypothetical protein SFX73_34950 [Kofleriaceae bacterium]|nr:hypothetical protein [Kofleriaceae bacterium]
MLEDTTDPRHWRKDGWSARVVKNEDDDGWAVEMMRAGDDEPALVTPWTMGRDKKNPKPLDQSAFMTLVKTAREVLLRHEQAARARLHRTFNFAMDSGQRIRVDLDIVPDDDDPHALIKAFDEVTNELIREGRTSPAFKLTATSAARFVETGEA